MELNKFDKFLWRFNGIVLALSCIGGVLFALWAVVSLCRTFNTNPVAVVASTTQTKSKKSELRLREFEQVEGTNLLVAPLADEGSSGKYIASSFSSSGSGSYDWAPRNYLFLDQRDGSSHWLAADNKSKFVSQSELYEDPKAKEEKKKVIAFVYEVAPAKSDDESGDEDEDKPRADRKIILYDLASGSTKTLIDGVQNLVTAKQVSKTEVLIVFKSGAKHIVLAIEPTSGKPIYKQELAATIADR